MIRKLAGRWGEAQAAQYLRKKGYRILAANYHCRFGEIDLIASKKDIVAFVEVKLRKNDDFAQALEQVDAAKQKRLIRTAQMWIAENGDKLQPRFDIIEIYAPNGINADPERMIHMENAFGVNV